MEIPVERMEEVTLRRIDLLKELRDCLAREREHLIQCDVRNLWAVMEEKQGLLESLEEAVRELREIHGQGPMGRDAAPEDRMRLQGLSRQVSALKREISVRVGENMAFTRETLGFFDELFSVLTAGAGGASYSPGMKRGRGEQGNLFLHREV